MAGHRANGKGTGFEGQSSEPHYVLTGGKVLTGPAMFQNGLPGDPPKPKMRGDAKPVGTGQYPQGAKNPSNKGPFEAFGIRSGAQGGRGGKKGMSD